LTTFSNIEDKKLRKEVMELSQWLNQMMAGKKAYSFKKLIDYRDDIVKRFTKYIKRERKDIRKATKKYDATKKEVKETFKYAEQNIITTYAQNMRRAFGQAAHSIEKTLKKQLSAPGFFGVGALLRLTKKRPKPKDLKRVEGISRLKRGGGIFRIDLIPYIMLVTRTAQKERDRQLSETIAVAERIDLVRISPHPCWLGPRADEVCNRWRDKIVSRSGYTTGFPTMRQAKSEKPPLFHPNCTHSFFPLTRIEQEVAIKKKIKTYKTLVKYT